MKSTNAKFLKAEAWSGARWLLTLCISFSITVIIYILIHLLINGSEYTLLSKEQMQNINNLLLFHPDTSVEGNNEPQNNETVNPEKAALILSYLESEYDNKLNENDSLQIKTMLVQFTPKDASSFLAQKRFTVAGYFWLSGPGAYAETLLWALIGVFASLIYYVSIANKEKIKAVTEDDGCIFDPAEIPAQVAKMFYAPVCALILVLGYSFLQSDESVLDLNAGKGLILFSFIAGFFSSRVMKFLDGLKKLILPLSDDSGAVMSAPPEKNKDVEVQLKLSPSFEETGDAAGITDQDFNNASVTLIQEDGEVIMLHRSKEARGFIAGKVPYGKYELNGEMTFKHADDTNNNITVRITGNKEIEVEKNSEKFTLELDKPE